MGTHSHIVPEGLLKAWTADGKLAVGWTSGRETEVLPPGELAVRSRFYRERYDDGTRSDWFEGAMSRLEGKALPVIRRVEELWPLEGKERGHVAEFMALQLMRTPAWREWYGGALERAEANTEGAKASAEARAAAAQIMRSDQQRHTRIGENLAPVGTVFLNMRWTLLRCGASRLATSDHPVVTVPLAAERLRAITAVPEDGVLGTAEARLALSPRHLLVLSWADDWSAERIQKMTVRQLRNHNAAVIEQADVQWFHHPQHRPERMQGPLSPLYFETDGPHDARGVRWRVVSHATQEMLDAEPPTMDMRIIEWSSMGLAA